MESLLRSIVVSVLVTVAWSDIDTDVCSPVSQSCGPVTPPLPVNFELKGEIVNYATKSMIYEEMYYDFDNLRGKFMRIANGLEVHVIFDYNVSQVIEYIMVHPGSPFKADPLATCAATEMQSSRYKNLFGYRFRPNGMTNTPMYDSAHVLRFGGPYQYAYNGSSGDEDDGRGLKWNAFIGCVYEDDGESTRLIRYKFSAEDMLTSGGNRRTDVDGSGIEDPLSVPLAVNYTGTIFVTDSDGERYKAVINGTESFSWFKANPVFDNKNLQIPPWMYCDKYRGWKSMPSVPMAFSVRLETTAYTQDMDGKTIAARLLSVEQLYYYSDRGLARRDFTPFPERDSEILENFGNGSPVKQVFDYLSLQIYTINKATGQCFSSILDQHAYFSVPDILETQIATPKRLFLMDEEDMEYKGQYFVRDIECDVWAGRYYDQKMNLTFFKETYFTTNGWHSEVDEKIEYRVPIKHTVIANQGSSESARTVMENNFFKFKAYPPVLIAFDISECVETMVHKYFAIKLDVPEGDPQNTLRTYEFNFREAAQYYLAQVSDLVSPLRVQKLKLKISKSGVFLTFAMLEKPESRNGIINPSKGETVDDAANNLQKVVDEGNFQITFKNPLNNLPIVVEARPQSFYEYDPSGNSIPAKKIQSSSLYNENKPVEPQVIYEHFDREVKRVLYDDAEAEKAKAPGKKSGMSRGALAALSIGMLLLGLAVGIAGMYLYFRKYGQNTAPGEYVMHTSSHT